MSLRLKCFLVISLLVALCLCIAGWGAIRIKRNRILAEQQAAITHIDELLARADAAQQRFSFDEADAEIERASDIVAADPFVPGASEKIEIARKRAKEKRGDFDLRVAQGYRLSSGELLSPEEQALREERIREAAGRQKEEVEALAEQERQKERAEHRRTKEARRMRAESARRSAMIEDWKAYMADCGTESQNANELRSKKTFEEQYKNAQINWLGFVYAVKQERSGTKICVELKMDPTESFGSDVSIMISARHEDFALGLSKGDTVEVVGYIRTQGSSISNHVIDATKVTIISAKPAVAL